MPEGPILETEQLTKQFEELIAVDDVSWQVSDGATKAVIGPNGAGKTTFFNMLTGVLNPTSGKIRLSGTDITDSNAHTIANQGLVKTFQINNLYDSLTVFENILIGVQSSEGIVYNPFSRVKGNSEFKKKTYDVIDKLELREVADVEVQSLSYGDQRKVEIGLALSTDPKVIVLDEPTAGMSQQEKQYVLSLINQLQDDSELTIVITEHDIDVVMDLAQVVTVMHNGSIIAENTPERIRNDERVQEVYLGGV